MTKSIVLKGSGKPTIMVTRSSEGLEESSLFEDAFLNQGFKLGKTSTDADIHSNSYLAKPSPQTNLLVTAEEHNAAFDPANEALGGAFMAGFREGWIYAETDADGERYQEMAEEYSLAVDTAPGEAWDAHRAKFFAMLPLAAIPTMGTPIADTEAEIARVVQSVNEWDDRTSPDDYPDHLLITSEELADILRNFAAALEGSDNG